MSEIEFIHLPKIGDIVTLNGEKWRIEFVDKPYLRYDKLADILVKVSQGCVMRWTRLSNIKNNKL